MEDDPTHKVHRQRKVGGKANKKEKLQRKNELEVLREKNPKVSKL